MSDLALFWNAEDGLADLAMLGADLATDDGLRTACIISLFSDRRAREDDILPDGSGDRRGWWADGFAEVSGDQIGSRLWLLSRSKQTIETLRSAEDYAREALAWLVEDGVASGVSVTCEWSRPGVLGFAVEIQRPGQPVARFHLNWEIA